jgi:EAL domain-containing protein (putative c-di-GMP-specific phosphodiesterase class I)
MLDASVLSPESLGRLAGSLVRRGVSVAVKRIETARQLTAAVESGVDWVQGFHLDKPGVEPASATRNFQE